MMHCNLTAPGYMMVSATCFVIIASTIMVNYATIPIIRKKYYINRTALPALMNCYTKTNHYIKGKYGRRKECP